MLRSSLICAGLLLALSVVPTAASAATCSLRGQEGRKFGPTYVTKITVTRTSCTTGKRLVRAYYKCRVVNGGKRGRCHKRVRGFRCTERRTNIIPTSYDSRVTCRDGSRRVVHDYTQLT